jgi:hypothetical protein
VLPVNFLHPLQVLRFAPGFILSPEAFVEEQVIHFPEEIR